MEAIRNMFTELWPFVDWGLRYAKAILAFLCDKLHISRTLTVGHNYLVPVDKHDMD